MSESNKKTLRSYLAAEFFFYNRIRKQELAP